MRSAGGLPGALSMAVHAPHFDLLHRTAGDLLLDGHRASWWRRTTKILLGLGLRVSFCVMPLRAQIEERVRQLNSFPMPLDAGDEAAMVAGMRDPFDHYLGMGAIEAIS